MIFFGMIRFMAKQISLIDVRKSMQIHGVFPSTTKDCQLSATNQVVFPCLPSNSRCFFPYVFAQNPTVFPGFPSNSSFFPGFRSKSSCFPRFSLKILQTPAGFPGFPSKSTAVFPEKSPKPSGFIQARGSGHTGSSRPAMGRAVRCGWVPDAGESTPRPLRAKIMKNLPFLGGFHDFSWFLLMFLLMIFDGLSIKDIWVSNCLSSKNW